MAVELKMPKMGLTMSTAQVVKWLKNVGDQVRSGEAVVEVMTDKLTNQVESPQDGVLLKIEAEPGNELEAGAVLGFIGKAGEAITSVTGSKPVDSASLAKSSPDSSPGLAASGQTQPKTGGQDGTERVLSTPVARNLAKEKGIDLSLVKGTGPGGRITKEDVEAYQVAQPETKAESALKAVDSKAREAQTFEVETSGDKLLKTEPYIGMRLAIGRSMHKSWSDIPRVTLHTEVIMDNLLEFRAEINKGAEPMAKVTVTDLLAKIVTSAIKVHPEVNALFDGTKLLVYEDIHLAVAVALDNGLVVPVVRRAGEKSLSVISREIKSLVHRARAGTLTGADLKGGTITITNLGGYGSVDTFNPIINLPQVVIIGFGRTRQIPAVKDGQIVVASAMNISVTHDHRVLDGAPVAAFMATLNSMIESPVRYTL
jgi:pyruvate dehydrogenase E2 component (dihydrolipoamide acetyltransferase)